MADIYTELKDERAYQDSKWGTKFDDQNTPHQWFSYIGKYGSRNLAGFGPVDLEAFRTDMVKVASLAIAAIESIDRKVP